MQLFVNGWLIFLLQAFSARRLQPIGIICRPFSPPFFSKQLYSLMPTFSLLPFVDFIDKNMLHFVFSTNGNFNIAYRKKLMINR